MRQVIMNYRSWLLVTLVAFAICAIIAMPLEGIPMARWFALFFGSKAVGLVCLHVAIRLYERWEKRGEIDWLNKIGKEE